MAVLEDIANPQSPNVLGAIAQGQQVAENILSARATRQAREAATRKQAAVQQLTPGAVSGDKESMNMLAGVDPEAASHVAAYINNVSEADRKRIEFGNQKLASYAAYVSEAGTPKEAQERWTSARNLMKNQGIKVDEIPEQFDPQFLRMAMNSATSIDKILERQRGTDIERNLEAAGYKKGTPEFQKAMKDYLTKPKEVIMQGETELAKAEGKKMGEYRAELYQNTQKSARATRQTANQYATINKLLDDVYTGTGGDVLQSAKKAAQMMGIDLGEVGKGEAGSALANQLALKFRNPEGGAGMPGALSDKDREFLMSMTPNLFTTSRGRAILGKVYERLAAKEEAIAAMARDYRKKHGSLDEGFEDVLTAKFKDESVFKDLYDQVDVQKNTKEMAAEMEKKSVEDLEKELLGNAAK